MNILIFIVITIIAIITMATTPSKSKNNEGKKLEDQINSCIRDYNDVQQQFVTRYNKILSKTIDYNDMTALESIDKIYDTYAFYQKRFDDNLKCINQIAENPHIQKSDLGKINRLDEEMQAIITKMKIEESNITGVSPQEQFNEDDFDFDNEPQPEPANNNLNFFKGCNTKEMADKRYRSLAKAFHPDTGTGDTDLFAELQNEYEKLKF